MSFLLFNNSVVEDKTFELWMSLLKMLEITCDLINTKLMNLWLLNTLGSKLILEQLQNAELVRPTKKIDSTHYYIFHKNKSCIYTDVNIIKVEPRTNGCIK